MERADGNRKMWLLKRTSDHHRPECLAAAIALGVLAGLVPKLNLLAVMLYGLILLLPVHTLLAITISLAVSLLSFQLDSTAHALGQLLLRESALRPMWSSLERAPLVPWMSLHNTVVLGHALIGLVLLAPLYLISLRIFERIEYGTSAQRRARDTIHSLAPVPAEESIPLTTKNEPFRVAEPSPGQRTSPSPKPQESTVDRSSLIIPPPKLTRIAADSRSNTRYSVPDAPDEAILFEPIDSPSQSINAWHMNHASGASSLASATASNKPRAAAAEAKLPAASTSKPAKFQSDDFYPQRSEAALAGQVEDKRPLLPGAPQRPDGIMNSLELAQSASEVLAWVDDLLDECLAEEGMSLAAQPLDASATSSSSASGHGRSDSAERDISDSASEPRWLVETTIEIVRLTDETMSDQLMAAEQSVDCRAQTDLSQPRSTENSAAMSSETMTRAWPGVGGVATASSVVPSALPVQDAGEPTILNLNQATGRSLSDHRTGFQQLVMAANGREPEPRSTLPIEPVKGECLAYLLGHLRQSREGKSS